jgi:hypothetical protein
MGAQRSRPAGGPHASRLYPHNVQQLRTVAGQFAVVGVLPARPQHPETPATVATLATVRARAKRYPCDSCDGGDSSSA